MHVFGQWKKTRGNPHIHRRKIHTDSNLSSGSSRAPGAVGHQLLQKAILFLTESLEVMKAITQGFHKVVFFLLKKQKQNNYTEPIK